MWWRWQLCGYAELPLWASVSSLPRPEPRVSPGSCETHFHLSLGSIFWHLAMSAYGLPPGFWTAAMHRCVLATLCQPLPRKRNLPVCSIVLTGTNSTSHYALESKTIMTWLFYLSFCEAVWCGAYYSWPKPTEVNEKTMLTLNVHVSKPWHCNSETHAHDNTINVIQFSSV